MLIAKITDISQFSW